MPRYFFNFLEDQSRNLVRDSEGIVLPDAGEAKREALGLARDFADHGFSQSMQSWEIVVVDESGKEVLSLPLADVHRSKIRIWQELARRFSAFKIGLRPDILGWLMAAVMVGVIAQATVKLAPVSKRMETYRTASAQAEDGVVIVRFAPQASVADVTKFLRSYNASIVAGPQMGDLYRLRFNEATLPQDERSKIVDRMKQDRIVTLAAAAE